MDLEIEIEMELGDGKNGQFLSRSILFHSVVFNSILFDSALPYPTLPLLLCSAELFAAQ
jgi:hypothetical protein